MTFKDLKQGYSIYLIDRAKTKISTGTIVSVSAGRRDIQMGASAEMVADITIDCQGTTKTYVVKEGASVAYGDEITLAVDRESAIREVESMKAKAQQAINTMDAQRQIVANCTEILFDLNPELKEKQATEKRMNAIEDKLNQLLTALNARNNETHIL